MNLPQKTFLTQDFALYESDFECNGQIKMLRVMQLLQDVATRHAEQINLGWDNMDAHGMLWVVSKMKITVHAPVTRKTQHISLCTWPLAPNRFFAERCFAAVENGKLLFSATSMWSIISRDQRKILPAETMNEFFHGEYDTVHCDTTSEFARVRQDETFVPAYETAVFRSDLDHNGHVNNTHYVTYATNVLAPQEQLLGMEIIYHKELKLGDRLQVFCKRQGNTVQVVGVRGGETCFTALLQVAQ